MDEDEIKRRLLQMPMKVARRWCHPGELGCACLGCANRSGGLAKLGVTEEQWRSAFAAITASAPESP